MDATLSGYVTFDEHEASTAYATYEQKEGINAKIKVCANKD